MNGQLTGSTDRLLHPPLHYIDEGSVSGFGWSHIVAEGVTV